MSIRGKLIAALLLTGLAAVGLVGSFTYERITHKVDLARRQDAAAHFQTTVAAYLARYGNWQAANAAEPFPQFAQHEAERGGPGGANGPREQPDDGPPDMASRNGAPDEERPPEGPPPEEMAPPPGQEASGPEARGPRGQHDAPPFRFILTDADFKVLLGAGVYREGDSLPIAAREGIQPVLVNGKVAAYLSPQGVLTPSRQEQEFLDTVRESLLLGCAGAALLALGLGLLLGTGLSRALRTLTGAVGAIQEGALGRQVAISGSDEVATLAGAFNKMSCELAKNDQELRARHQTILEQAEKLKELSIRDGLTELYNRRHFDAQAQNLFEQSQRSGRPLTLVIADIDHFKRVNDQFSHATGDAVLRHVSAILRSHTRLNDLVARYGGEEFVMALPDTSLPQAEAMCNKLRTLIEQFPWQDIHPNLKVTMSLGVCANLTAGTAEKMLQFADTLLYRAKESGRNRVCVA